MCIEVVAMLHRLYKRMFVQTKMFPEKMEEKAEDACGKGHGWRCSWRVPS